MSKESLDAATADVVRCAQYVIENGSQHSREGEVYYKVPDAEFLELAAAWKVWKKANDDYVEEPKSRTLQQLVQEALDVQNACNLSAVVHSFSRVMTELRAILSKEEGFSTDKLNQHPVCRLFSDKIASLTGTQFCNDDAHSNFASAYNWAKEITK